jgi:hypothetical protein
MEINNNTGSIRDMALRRASAKQEAREQARISNRKSIDRNATTEKAFFNQISRATRATAAIRDNFSQVLESFNSATDAVDTIKSNLQEIRDIVDAGIKGILVDTDAGQERINELVTEIKSLTENTKYADKNVFGGSFSYKALLNSNDPLSLYSKDLSNTETGIVAAPIASGITASVSPGVTINQNSQDKTDGYRWVNTTINDTGFAPGDAGQQTSIAVNNQYIVKNEEDLSGYTMKVYDKDTGAEISSYSNSQLYQASPMALNNNNQLVQAKAEGLFLDDLDSAAVQDNFELKDGSNQTITGITSLDISDNYIVATKATLNGNGGKAYIFNASTGAFIQEITDTTDEPYSRFGSAVAVDGNTLVIGAQYTSGEANTAGKKGGYVKTYDLSSGSAVEQDRIDVESSIFGVNGFASKLDFEGNTLIVNAGTKSLVYDLSGVNPVQKGTIDQGQQVKDYQIAGDRVLIQDSLDTTKIYDLKNFKDINTLYVTDGSNHSVESKGAVAFDGNSIFSQERGSSSSNIQKSTLLSVSNNILGSDLMGQQVASTDNYIISLAPGRDNNGVRDSGSLFVYDKLSGQLVKEFKDITLNRTDGQPVPHTYLDNFALAASGNKIALLDRNGDRGMVFDIGTSAVDTFAIAFADSDTIAISGDNIAVGSISAKAVSIFKQDSNTGNVASVRTINRSLSGGVSFGDSIDLEGDVLVVADSGRGQIETFDLTTGNSRATTAPFAGRSSTLKSKVSISGNRIAVSNINNAGAVGLYNLNLVNQGAITDVGTAVANKFGESIDLQGDYLAVGASNEQNPTLGAGKGAVHLYDLSVANYPKISTMFSTADIASNTSGFGSSVSISGNRVVVGAPNGAGVSGENGGNINLFDISLGASYTDYPFARPKSLIRFSRGLHIDVGTQYTGSFATGTNNALQNISISSTVASLGGRRDLANFRDLYDIDQMLANLGSISDRIKDETRMLNRYATANQSYYDYNRRQFDRLNANKISVQANSNPTQVANLLP